MSAADPISDLHEAICRLPTNKKSEDPNQNIKVQELVTTCLTSMDWSSITDEQIIKLTKIAERCTLIQKDGGFSEGRFWRSLAGYSNESKTETQLVRLFRHIEPKKLNKSNGDKLEVKVLGKEITATIKSASYVAQLSTTVNNTFQGIQNAMPKITRTKVPKVHRISVIFNSSLPRSERKLDHCSWRHEQAGDLY